MFEPVAGALVAEVNAVVNQPQNNTKSDTSVNIAKRDFTPHNRA